MRASEIALIVLATLAVVAAAKLAEAFLVPVVVGILISYTLRPLVTGLERLHVHRAVGAAVVLVALTGALTGIVYTLRDEASEVIADLPQTARKLRAAASATTRGPDSPVAQMREAAAEIEQVAADAAGKKPAQEAAPPPVAGEAQTFIGKQTAQILGVLTQLGMAGLLAYFVLAAGDTFRRKVVHLAGRSLAKRRDAVELLNEIDAQVSRYMGILLVTNVLIGLATWLILAALGLEGAPIWGVVAGILHIIPYAGTAVTAAVVAVVSFLQTNSLGDAAIAASAVTFAAVVIGMGLATWLQGRASQMNAVAVFIAVIFFGWLWGGWGLLLGTPLLAVLKAIADRVDDMHAITELLGGGATKAKEEPPKDKDEAASVQDKATQTKAADEARLKPT
ncbi:MAG: AI-2E family transporter [Betaproteobacteria bacterium]|nr:AI-2E family transporter [Betaproteobacteria bacterium]